MRSLHSTERGAGSAQTGSELEVSSLKPFPASPVNLAALDFNFLQDFRLGLEDDGVVGWQFYLKARRDMRRGYRTIHTDVNGAKRAPFDDAMDSDQPTYDHRARLFEERLHQSAWQVNQDACKGFNHVGGMISDGPARFSDGSAERFVAVAK